MKLEFRKTRLSEDHQTGRLQEIGKGSSERKTSQGEVSS